MFKKFLSFLPQIIASLFLAGFVAYAWTEPSQSPPDGNVAAPVNVGSSDQTFSGSKTLWMKGDETGTMNLRGAFNVRGISQFLSDVFFGGNVGIGTTNPSEQLEVADGIKTKTITVVGDTAVPTCNSSKRGKLFLLQGGAGIADGFYICKKKTDGTFTWIALGSPKLVRATTFSFSGSLPYGTWSSIASWSIPESAKYWSCDYAVDKKTSSRTYCLYINTQIICGGTGIFSWNWGPADDYYNLGNFGIARTPLFPINNATNCVLEANFPNPPCTAAQDFSVIQGSCYYTQPEQ